MIFGPPPVRGVGRAGGFMIMIEDRGDLGPRPLQAQTENLVELANQQPELVPRQHVGLPGQRAAGLPRRRPHGAACSRGSSSRTSSRRSQVYLGSLYVNDFNLFGRTWQVIVQAEAKYRDQIDDIRRLRVRNSSGTMVPLGSLADVREVNGPLVLTRYNMYPAASINGNARPGVSSGQGHRRDVEPGATGAAQVDGLRVDRAGLPRAAGRQHGDDHLRLLVVMVFLVLAAQYESWSMPLAVILVGADVPPERDDRGEHRRSMDINIFTQIGLVVLVGLASKNAILIVEFAKVIRRSGQPIREATLEACRLRLRPIIMTSMAFILGVLPLLFAHGAGAEMRRTLGTAVFSGMLGVTLFGIFLTPVFFYLIDSLSESHLFASPTACGRSARSLLGIITLSYLSAAVALDRVRPDDAAGRQAEAVAAQGEPRAGAVPRRRTSEPGSLELVEQE